MADESTEQTTSVEALNASLTDLLKAADATSIVDGLRKSVSTSGSISEEGGRGDDFADSGDAGSIEDLMIGKMVAAGMGAEAARDIAASMRGHMGSAPTQATSGGKGFPMVQHDRVSPKGKAFGQDEGGEEEEEEGEEEEPEEQPQGKMRGKRGKVPPQFAEPGMQKSFAEQFAEDDDITKAVDVSPFIEAITARTADGLDAIAKSVRIGRRDQTRMNKAMAVALYQTGALLKSQSHVIAELGRRLNIVEAQPQPTRGFVGEPAAKRALVKALPGAGGGEQKLTKRNIVSALSYMNLEKGIKEIGGTRTTDLIVKAEAGDITGKSVLDAVNTFLRVHPMERDAAINYT